MRFYTALTLAVIVDVAAAAPVLAQRLPFERSFEMSGPTVLDVSTVRGKIDISAGAPGKVVVHGTVTIRIGWNVPSNAMELAHNVADRPPIERQGNSVRLRVPADEVERRAVIVSYVVEVPSDAEVITLSESGATSIRGISGRVAVRTQSAAIRLAELGAQTTVETGSGAVVVDGAAGALSVTTSSSGFTGRALRGDLKVRTQSGAIAATFSGSGDADVETGSSAINLRGLSGGLRATTESGHVAVDGTPVGTWSASTGSGGVDVNINTVALAIDAATGSGSVNVIGGAVDGSVSKKKAAGSIGGGGPLLRVTSRSGSIRVRLG